MEDTFSDKLSREWQLAQGLGQGLVDGASGALSHYALSTVVALGSGLLAYRLGMASPVATAAWRLAGKAMNAAFAVDIAQWTGRAGWAAADAWSSPTGMEANLKTARSLGSEAFDTGALFLAGAAGMKTAQLKLKWQNELPNLESIFAGAGPDRVPRLQRGFWLRPKTEFIDADSEPGQFFTKHSPAVGQLLGDQASASTFYIDKSGLWSTNYHAVQGQTNLRVLLDGVEHKASVKLIDPAADIAFVKTQPVANLKPLELDTPYAEASRIRDGARDPAMNGGAVIIGHPTGAPQRILTDTVTGRYARPTNPEADAPLWQESPFENAGGHSYYLFTVGTAQVPYPGGSGSPILNSLTGNLKAMLASHSSTLGWGISADHLRPALAYARLHLPGLPEGQVLKVSTSIKYPQGSNGSIFAQPVEIQRSSIVTEESIANSIPEFEAQERAANMIPNWSPTFSLAGTIASLEQLKKLF
jgi:S1-C subfamily serine protease